MYYIEPIQENNNKRKWITWKKETQTSTKQTLFIYSNLCSSLYNMGTCPLNFQSVLVNQSLRTFKKESSPSPWLHMYRTCGWWGNNWECGSPGERVNASQLSDEGSATPCVWHAVVLMMLSHWCSTKNIYIRQTLQCEQHSSCPTWLALHIS